MPKYYRYESNTEHLAYMHQYILHASSFRVIENGVETVTVEEDGIVKSLTVNGEPQAIGY